MNEPLSFEEYKEKYRYKRSDEVIAYELYLILKKIDSLNPSMEYDEDTDICEASKLQIPTTCDNCQFLGSNGICGYCKFTLNCYDGENDLVDGKVMKDCPFNYKEENKRLKRMLENLGYKVRYVDE